MKTQTKSKLNNVLLICSLCIIGWFMTSPATAQKLSYRSRTYQPGSGRFFIGLESGAGTASYKFSSNINDLKDLKVKAQGWNAGVLLGDRNFKVRATYGKYSFQKAEGKRINQSMISAKVNLTVPRLLGKSKFLRMYVVTGVDYSVFSFDGIVIPKYIDPKEKLEKEIVACCCPQTSGGPPPDPGAPVADGQDADASTSQKETVSAKSVVFEKTQINAGLGAEFQLAGKGKYFRVFAEAYYGIPLKPMADVNMSQTNTTGQMVINFGVGIGINR